MRVLHVCFSDSRGGAAIGAYRLHYAMKNRGVDSTMLVAHKGTADASVTTLVSMAPKGELQSHLSAGRDLSALYGIDKLPIRSTNLTGFEISDFINNRHKPEIVQLHWIANSTVKLSDLQKIQKPIVWKMPDMWPFSGGEHYIRHGDIERYKVGYDKTDPFIGEVVDVDRLVWEAKKIYYKDLPLTIASPSKFLARAAHESVLLGEYDAHTIPNPLPWQFFAGGVPPEVERDRLRKVFNLPTDKLLIMFSAFDVDEKRKGYHHVEDMLINHLPDIIPPSKAALMICGSKEAGVDNVAGYDLFKFESTNDVDRYKKYLRAADLMLFPSEMDSTAMVIQEALSQGLPSIVFDVGGLPEMIKHKENGYLASPYSTKELASGIQWWINCSDREVVRKNAMSGARAMHNPAITVERYLNLYKSVIEKHRTKTSFKSGTLHESVPFVSVADTKSRAFIVDPSAVNKGDSSHHAEHVAAFSAMLESSEITPHLVVNKEATLENPFGDTKKVLSWTVYDKIRADRDVRDGPSLDVNSVERFDQSSDKSLEVYATLMEIQKEYSIARRDAIIFPTADRFCIEAALQFLYSAGDHYSPSIHMNIMFEKAEFMLGRYPLKELMRAARESGYLQKKLFLYAETKQMASDLSSLLRGHVECLAPPHLFQKDQLDSVAKTNGGKGWVRQHERDTYALATKSVYDVAAVSSVEIPSNKHVIVSLGRGRKDKGWNMLPNIVEAFNATPLGKKAVFVFQRPRKMDNLKEEVSRIEKFSNVILLDEIVETNVLNEICSKADVFLLPYSPGVYRNRGSAFGWRAVLQEKPLVVMGGTALTEALLPSKDLPNAPIRESERFNFFLNSKTHSTDEPYCNGKVARTATEFSDALAKVLNDKRFFRAGAKMKLAQYFQSCVRDNPIKSGMLKDNFSGERHTLIIRSNAHSGELPEEAFLGFYLTLNVSDSEDDDFKPIPLIGGGGVAPIAVQTQLNDDAIDPESFPDFLRDALVNGRIDTIYVPGDLAIKQGGLRLFRKEWMGSVVLY